MTSIQSKDMYFYASDLGKIQIKQYEQNIYNTIRSCPKNKRGKKFADNMQTINIVMSNLMAIHRLAPASFCFIECWKTVNFFLKDTTETYQNIDVKQSIDNIKRFLDNEILCNNHNNNFMLVAQSEKIKSSL